MPLLAPLFAYAARHTRDFAVAAVAATRCCRLFADAAMAHAMLSCYAVAADGAPAPLLRMLRHAA